MKANDGNFHTAYFDHLRHGNSPIIQQGNLLFNDYHCMQMQLIRSLFQQMYFLNVLHTTKSTDIFWLNIKKKRIILIGCLSFAGLGMAAAMSEIWTIAAIAFERCRAIKNPLTRARQLNRFQVLFWLFLTF